MANWRNIVRIMSLFGAAAVPQSCTTKSPNPLPVSGIDGPAIVVKAIPENRPKFKREYTATLSINASIKITIRTGWRGQRDNSGELDQPNGRWILFDPDKIADKIIDPQLVSLIQNCVDRIYAMDAQYVGTRPDLFTDEGGDVWIRKP